LQARLLQQDELRDGGVHGVRAQRQVQVSRDLVKRGHGVHDGHAQPARHAGIQLWRRRHVTARPLPARRQAAEQLGSKVGGGARELVGGLHLPHAGVIQVQTVQHSRHRQPTAQHK